MKILLPKGYLSHSAITLWKKNKEEYRKRYYLGGKPATSPELRFGSKIHNLIEKNDVLMNFIPRYQYHEEEMFITIEKIPVLAYFDAYDSYPFVGADYKTGTKTWTDLRTRQSDQLTFYAMIAKYKLGVDGDQTWKIHWIPTHKTNTEYNGFETGKEIEYTGRVETFERVIEPWEIKRQVESLVMTANEISNDYLKFIQTTL